MATNEPVRDHATHSHAAERRPGARLALGVRRPRWSGYTAFVLSGGGARGALQVGALRALLEYGERPDVIVGTSIGAWNGAWIARGPSLERVEALERIWRGMSPARVLLGREPYGNPPPQVRAGVFMLAAARRVTQGYPSLYGDVGLRQVAAQVVGDLTFEDLALPLRVIAANLSAGTREIFSAGPLMPALLASAAIPGIFPPVRIGESVYVDGGALDNTSLDIALQMGARRLFVLDVGYQAPSAAPAPWSVAPGLGPGAERPRGGGTHATHALAAVLERTAQVMSGYHLDHALKRVPRGVEVHLIRPTTADSGGVLDFGNAPEWIERAYTFTREYLRGALAPRQLAAPVPAGDTDAAAAPAPVAVIPSPGRRG